MAYLSLLDLILMANLFLSGLILITVGSYTYSRLTLIQILYLFQSPVGFTEPMLIQRYLNTYCYLDLSHISRRSSQNIYLSYGVYTCSEIPVDITEITECIMDLRNLILYGSTRKYYLIKCLL